MGKKVQRSCSFCLSSVGAQSRAPLGGPCSQGGTSPWPTARQGSCWMSYKRWRAGSPVQVATSVPSALVHINSPGRRLLPAGSLDIVWYPIPSQVTCGINGKEVKKAFHHSILLWGASDHSIAWLKNTVSRTVYMLKSTTKLNPTCAKNTRHSIISTTYSGITFILLFKSYIIYSLRTILGFLKEMFRALLESKKSAAPWLCNRMSEAAFSYCSQTEQISWCVTGKVCMGGRF